MLHQLIVVWFHFVENWGYLGVFLLMALESSIVPVPSEIVMPPAAYWAAQGKMNFWLVVLAGTVGSYFGSIVSYLVARAVGYPIVKKYGKYFLLSEAKILSAEGWVKNYGVMGIFLARLLPVIRHLISIPAGLFKMKIAQFSFSTILGAFSWCLILSWLGAKIIGDQPDLLTSPANMVLVLKAKLHWLVAAVAGFAVAYSLMVYLKKKQTKQAS